MVIFVVFIGGRFLYDKYSNEDLIGKLKESMSGRASGYEGLGSEDSDLINRANANSRRFHDDSDEEEEEDDEEDEEIAAKNVGEGETESIL